MTIFEFVALLRRNWLPIVVSALLGVTVAVCLALFVVSPSYTATLKLYVSGTGTLADDRLAHGEYARTHISSYADMVNSNNLLQAVRDDLGLPPTEDGGPDELAASISAENPLDTLIINVAVQDPSPQRAQAVAAAIGEAYDPVVARLETASDGGASPVRVNVLSPPHLPTVPDSPSRKLYAAAGLLIGMAVGVGAALLRELRPVRPRARAVPERTSRHGGSSDGQGVASNRDVVTSLGDSMVTDTEEAAWAGTDKRGRTYS